MAQPAQPRGKPEKPEESSDVIEMFGKDIEMYCTTCKRVPHKGWVVCTSCKKIKESLYTHGPLEGLLDHLAPLDHLSALGEGPDYDPRMIPLRMAVSLAVHVVMATKTVDGKGISGVSACSWFPDGQRKLHLCPTCRDFYNDARGWQAAHEELVKEEEERQRLATEQQPTKEDLPAGVAPEEPNPAELEEEVTEEIAMELDAEASLAIDAQEARAASGAMKQNVKELQREAGKARVWPETAENPYGDNPHRADHLKGEKKFLGGREARMMHDDKGGKAYFREGYHDVNGWTREAADFYWYIHSSPPTAQQLIQLAQEDKDGLHRGPHVPGASDIDSGRSGTVSAPFGKKKKKGKAAQSSGGEGSGQQQMAAVEPGSGDGAQSAPKALPTVTEQAAAIGEATALKRPLLPGDLPVYKTWGHLGDAPIPKWMHNYPAGSMTDPPSTACHFRDPRAMRHAVLRDMDPIHFVTFPPGEKARSVPNGGGAAELKPRNVEDIFGTWLYDLLGKSSPEGGRRTVRRERVGFCQSTLKDLNDRAIRLKVSYTKLMKFKNDNEGANADQAQVAAVDFTTDNFRRGLHRARTENVRSALRKWWRAWERLIEELRTNYPEAISYAANEPLEFPRAIRGFVIERSALVNGKPRVRPWTRGDPISEWEGYAFHYQLPECFTFLYYAARLTLQDTDFRADDTGFKQPLRGPTVPPAAFPDDESATEDMVDSDEDERAGIVLSEPRPAIHKDKRRRTGPRPPMTRPMAASLTQHEKAVLVEEANEAFKRSGDRDEGLSW